MLPSHPPPPPGVRLPYRRPPRSDIRRPTLTRGRAPMGRVPDDVSERPCAQLDRELGLAAEDTAGTVGLHFHEVVDRRCGHPAMLAAIGAELALRAGVAAGVYA